MWCNPCSLSESWSLLLTSFSGLLLSMVYLVCGAVLVVSPKFDHCSCVHFQVYCLAWCAWCVVQSLWSVRKLMSVLAVTSRVTAWRCTWCGASPQTSFSSGWSSLATDIRTTHEHSVSSSGVLCQSVMICHGACKPPAVPSFFFPSLPASLRLDQLFCGR